ncbi:MAG: GGDEF domain-containing protein [Ideonella sp.]|nr:GGDEF domain-containing protein [Ideonella sp.]MCC7457498.1 GGDEF domain-containing protein [Nitrospira sp.]
MNPPIQLLYLGAAAPDLATSAFGPCVVQTCANLDDAAAHLRAGRFDALLLEVADSDALQALLQWAALSHATLAAAVLVATPEPTAPVVTRLLQLGVQEVLPTRAATADRLALALRQAVERKRIELQARRAHATDLGTGLPNHAQLMEHMTHLLALREREPAPMALLVLRVEGLAAAEARLGVEAANVLRRKVAVRLRSALRASDVVAALGADRFAVLLAWIDDAGDGDRVAAKLSLGLRRPLNVAGQDVAVAVGCGVARYPGDGREADTLLRLAAGAASQCQVQGRVGFADGHGRRGGAANDELPTQF